MSFEEKEEQLAKYLIIEELLDLDISVRDSGEFIFNLFHPMSRISEDLMEETYEISEYLDLF